MSTFNIRKKKKETKSCLICRVKREKAEAIALSLLLVTVVGCGLPGIVTIPTMIYLVVRASIPCKKCRLAKKQI